MINTEILAISAIFITGLYVGYKLKGAIYKVSEYYMNRRELNSQNNKSKNYF